MTSPARFIVLGTGGAFSFHVIQALIENSYLPLAYIQSGTIPDKQHTRLAEIEIEQPAGELESLLNDNDITRYYQASQPMECLVKNLQTEYLLVACWPVLISPALINSVSIAALNLHPSLLPKYRGFDPISQQLAREDHDFGITLHLLNERYDQGDIVLQQEFHLDEHPTAATINIEAARLGAKLFIRAINCYQNPGWDLTPQSR